MGHFIKFYAVKHKQNRNTLFQTISSVEMRSRVISIYTIVNLGLGPIGCFLAGSITEHKENIYTMLSLMRQKGQDDKELKKSIISLFCDDKNCFLDLEQ